MLESVVVTALNRRGLIEQEPVMLPLSRLSQVRDLLGKEVWLEWYYLLDDEDQREADRISAEFAWDLYRKLLPQLTADETQPIIDWTEAHFRS